MTDQDNLRDRIAVILAKAQNADYWTDEIAIWEGLEVWQREAYPDEYPTWAYEDRVDYRDYAQSIIDDLGLEVETQVAFFDGTPAMKPISHKRRVVGRWEDE